MKKNFTYKRLLPFLGVLLLAFILFYLIDLKTLLQTLKQVNYLYLIPVFLLTFLLLGLKSLRWQILMRKQNIKYSLIESFAIYSVAIFFSLVTPGKIGELAKVLYLRQDGHSVARSLVSIILDRLFDFFFLVFMALLGFIIFIQFFSQEIIYLLASLFIVLLTTYLLAKSKIYLKLLKFIVPYRFHSQFFENLQVFLSDLKKYKLPDYFKSTALTLLAWLVYICQIYCLSLSLNLNLNFLYLIPMISVANATDLLPISFNGLGTREAVFIFFFSLIGLSAEKATALGILQLFIVFFTALIGFYFWLKKPLLKK